jgi:hypothetical protein
MDRRRIPMFALLLVFVIPASAPHAMPSSGPTAVPAGQPPADEPEEEGPAQVDLQELDRTTPPTVGPVSIQAPRLPEEPAPGKGRLRLTLDGDRRWCTYPDDRVVHPPQPASSRHEEPAQRNAVYTFGYKFTIAAVERSHPERVVMLFESPVIRTAVYRQAAKLGRGAHPEPTGPQLVESDHVRVNLQKEQPSSIVPYWQEQYRCTTLPESFDIDLDPGLYDVYMAFDILLKSGNWAHRTTGYRTDVPVEAGRRTLLPGQAGMVARRRVLAFGEPSAAPEGGAGAR